MRCGWLALLALLAACYEPSFTPCSITCAPAGTPCPGDMTCGPGNVCIEPGGTCTDLTGPVHRTIVAGVEHLCAIDDVNRILCWGGNSHGQLAQPTTFRDADPIVVAPPVSGGTWIALAAGDFHTCGLYELAGGATEILCWGEAGAGQLGAETTTDARFFGPASLPELAWTGIGAGGNHSCAIAADAGGATTIHCWGASGAGQLTGAPGQNSPVPVPVPLPAVTGAWRMVDGATGHTCAVTTSGELACWGDNTTSQLTGTGSSPRLVDGAYAVVAAGAGHTCAITRAGTVACWGDNAGGLLGVGDASAIVGEPSAVSDRGTTERWAMLDTGARATCGLVVGAGTTCWGTGAPQLGLGTLGTGQTTPVTEVAGSAGVDVAVTPWTTCVHGGGRDLRCWGDSLHAELGDGTRTIAWTAVEVDGAGAEWKSVAAGAQHTCAVARDPGGMFRTLCFGLGHHGQSGPLVGPLDANPAPRPIEMLDLVEPRVAVGAAHTCVVRPRGIEAEAACYGDDSRRQNPGAAAGTPFVVGEESSPQITADGDYTCVTGSLMHAPRCWGTADGDAGHASDQPIAQSMNTPLREESVTWGGISGCGLAVADRSVWCFGTEQLGELGNGAAGPPAWQTSAQVSVLPAMQELVARGPGRAHCAAADASGVFCWGDNAHGQVTPATPNLPPAVDVPTATLTAAQISNEVDAITMGGTHGCAIHATNNQLICWGGYELGQRTTLPTSTMPSPITNPAIGVVRWQAISAGAEHTCAIVETSAGVGHLICWGRNTYGQLGTNVSARPTAGPVTIP